MHFHTPRWTRTRLSLSTFKRYLMCTNTEFISQISVSTNSTSFDFRDQVKEIQRLMCIFSRPNIVQITMLRSLGTTRHRCMMPCQSRLRGRETKTVEHANFIYVVIFSFHPNLNHASYSLSIFTHRDRKDASSTLSTLQSFIETLNAYQ